MCYAFLLAESSRYFPDNASLRLAIFKRRERHRKGENPSPAVIEGQVQAAYIFARLKPAQARGFCVEREPLAIIDLGVELFQIRFINFSPREFRFLRLYATYLVRYAFEVHLQNRELRRIVERVGRVEASHSLELAHIDHLAVHFGDLRFFQYRFRRYAPERDDILGLDGIDLVLEICATRFYLSSFRFVVLRWTAFDRVRYIALVRLDADAHQLFPEHLPRLAYERRSLLIFLSPRSFPDYHHPSFLRTDTPQ